jgi:transcriptional regulator with XRE-family HTH domain
MNRAESRDRTYVNFPEALRQLMEARSFSFPRLSREIGQKLSIAYIHNLASGKSRPTKDNIEIIASGIKVNPSYFKEYREYLAKEKINNSPEIVDFILDDKATELGEGIAALSDEEKQEVIEHIKELKAKYKTSINENFNPGRPI